MKPNQIQERILKICYNYERFSNELINMLTKKFGYKVQAIRNTLSDLHILGLIDRRKVGRHYAYETSPHGRNILLGVDIVDEIESRSSKYPKQLMLMNYCKKDETDL